MLFNIKLPKIAQYLANYNVDKNVVYYYNEGNKIYMKERECMKLSNAKKVILMVILFMIMFLISSQDVLAASKTSISKIKDVKVKSRTTSSITVKWKKNSSVKGYQVYMAKREKLKIY